MTNPEQMRKYANLLTEGFDPIVEGPGDTEYQDSAEFTDEFYGALQQLDAVASLMQSSKMSEWMSVTDSNFGTNCSDTYYELAETLATARALFNQLSDELEQAA